MKQRHLLFVLAGIAAALASCTSSSIITHALPGSQSGYCAPSVSLAHRYLPLANFDSLKHTDIVLASQLSEHDLLMANALGIAPLLSRLVRDTSATQRVHYINLANEIQNRLLLAASEIDGIAAELDCEGERSEQLAHYLDNLNNKRNNRLTAASIIIGAAITVTTAAVSNSDAQNAIGISGGLVTAGLGALILNPAGKKIQMDYTHRNILHDIWYTPSTSAIYTPFVWYMLNEKKFSNSHQVSLAQSIRTRWTNFEFAGKLTASREKLLFDTGGIYTAEDLHTRAALLNQLQSTIRSIHQDMQSLHASVSMLLQKQD
ncbi:MAG TPA: hypothetical protein VIN08_25660 [Ohtaekwangia sp.]|uniref:hypothetical protein n=1 Tax=Ohtaekwangia sp. TaxID=2066019 RepID=UPI002F929788